MKNNNMIDGKDIIFNDPKEKTLEIINQLLEETKYGIEQAEFIIGRKDMLLERYQFMGKMINNEENLKDFCSFAETIDFKDIKKLTLDTLKQIQKETTDELKKIAYFELQLKILLNRKGIFELIKKAEVSR